MIWGYVGAVILVLMLVGRIIRWWNLPQVEEERRKRAEKREEQRTERLRIRRENSRRRRKHNKEVEKP